MSLAPGSLPWLLRHDLRLNWRRFLEMFGSLPLVCVLAICLAGAALLHLLAWPLVIWLGKLKLAHAAAGGSTLVLLMLSVLAWMTAQGLIGASRALNERGSIDLVLSSPLPVRLALASRAISIAASSFASVALLGLPVANMGLLLDGPIWLLAYPALMALALIGTAAGLAIAIALFSRFGARRARFIAQLCAALIGTAFLLAMQVAALLPKAAREAIVEAFVDSGTARILDPVAAMPWLVLAAVAIFTAAVHLASDAFLRASLKAAGAPADGGGAETDRDQRVRFGAGLAQTLRRKEWRLLVRDQGLFAQLALQIVYTVPIAVVLLRGVENIPLATALAPAIVVIAAQIAASLAWIAVSGEDAPELIAAAPVRRGEVELAKVSAVGAPVLAILALPLIGMALLSPMAALLVALFAAGASVSTALVNLWHPMPGNRRGMLRRHSQSKLIALIEHLLAMLWAVAIVLAVTGTPWTLLPIALAAGVLALSRRAGTARS